jgi:hypothetical protein
MTTQAQHQANRRNALVSTGPRTPAGKAKVAGNALRSGLRTEAPVVPGERVEDWEAHCEGIVGDLAPVGSMEEELAGRVALYSWLSRRVARYETGATTAWLDGVEDEIRGGPDFKRLLKQERALARERKAVASDEGSRRLLDQLPTLSDDSPVAGEDACGVLAGVIRALTDSDDLDRLADHAFVNSLGVPKEELEAPFEWAGWTAGMVRRGVESLAGQFKAEPGMALAKALVARRNDQQAGAAQVRQLQRKVKELRGKVRAKEDRLRQQRLLLPTDTLDKIVRYTTHLHRLMIQNLHELQRLRAARGGERVPPPAALDVTVDAGGLPTEAITAADRA